MYLKDTMRTKDKGIKAFELFWIFVSRKKLLSVNNGGKP
jgi:hypothetical protein